MTTINVQYDSVRKYRNKHEWRPVGRATAEWGGHRFEAIGDHDVRKDLAKQLLAAGAPENAMLDVWRGSMPIFSRLPIQSALETRQRGEQPEALRRHREAQS